MKRTAVRPESVRAHLDTLFKGSSSQKEAEAAQALAWQGGRTDFELILTRISNAEKTGNFSSSKERRAVEMIVATMRREGNPGFPLLQALFRLADSAKDGTWAFAEEKLVEMCSMPRAREKVLEAIQSREERYFLNGNREGAEILKRLGGLKVAIEAGEVLGRIPSQAKRLRSVSTKPPRPIADAGERVLAWLVRSRK